MSDWRVVCTDSDPDTGAYSLDLPGEGSYRLGTLDGDGYCSHIGRFNSQKRTIDTTTQTGIQDFSWTFDARPVS